MTSRNKIYVFRTGILKPKTYFGKLVGIDGTPQTVLRNLVILAKSATERATRKKNRSASTVNGNQRFFSKMKTSQGDPNSIAFSAEASFPKISGNCAIPWTLTTRRTKIRHRKNEANLTLEKRTFFHYFCHQILKHIDRQILRLVIYKFAKRPPIRIGKQILVFICIFQK